MESYWDLYVAYVHKCVADNWANDVDPAHYEMEWNHFLPQCIFGDQPIGHWLTKRQHAIASALQTLAFQRNCMCGWHKKFLPASLSEEAWPYFGKASALRAKEGKGFHNFEQRSRAGRKSFELGLGVHSTDYRNSESFLEQRKKSGAKTSKLKIGIHSPGMASVGGSTAVKLKRGIHSPEHKGKGVQAANSQVWESTMDGFRSNAGMVAIHNKRNGWDPNARVRIS